MGLRPGLRPVEDSSTAKGALLANLSPTSDGEVLVELETAESCLAGDEVRHQLVEVVRTLERNHV